MKELAAALITALIIAVGFLTYAVIKIIQTSGEYGIDIDLFW